MVKHAFTLAALGSALSACAQSGITIFGVVDLAVRYVKSDQSTWQLADGGMATSRLVFAPLGGPGHTPPMGIPKL